MNLRALHILTLLIFACSGTIAQKKDTSKVNSGELLPVKRKFLYFVSNRMSEDDKYDLFKVLPSDREAGIIIIRGHVEFADDPSRKRARISVYNVSNNELVGIYNTNNYTGSYLMVLVPNIRYQFKIEAEGYEVMREIVEVPLKFDYEVGRQDIRIARNEKKKSVATVQNYFTDGNEKIFVLRTSIDSAKKESEKAGYAETD